MGFHPHGLEPPYASGQFGDRGFRRRYPRLMIWRAGWRGVVWAKPLGRVVRVGPLGVRLRRSATLRAFRLISRGGFYDFRLAVVDQRAEGRGHLDFV
jgi:hypothetical protein